jgi:His-Xaa-Ser system protein HxsD
MRLTRRTRRIDRTAQPGGHNVVAERPLDWVEVRDDGLVVHVDRRIYDDEATFRTCYVFTDRCYLFLERPDDNHLTVRFRKRNTGTDLTAIIGAFGNDLINQQLRIVLARETHGLREQIVKRAFADAVFDDGQ